MNVNLGRGFGPFDFDENGKMYSIFPEDLPYVDDDFDGDGADFTVYVDAELVETVCNAGLDFDDFLRADEDERRAMLEDAGINPNDFELDFDKDVRDRLEAEGYYNQEYEYEDLDDYDDEYDYEEDDSDDDEDEDEEDDEFEDEGFDDEDYDDDSDEDFDDDDDFDEDDDEDDDDFGEDGEDFDGGYGGRNGGTDGSGDAFFGNLNH